MKLRNLTPLAIAVVTSACAAAVGGESELPPDAEFGLETLDGKADSFAIRDGSPEGEAVIAFVNQPIADDAAGDAFFALLDSEMHKWAARNIVEFRAGDDGTFGTNDDRLYTGIDSVDRVRYVGRVALMQLHGLAIAHGFGRQGDRPCSTYFPSFSGYFSINTYADLLTIEQSKCNVFDGDVHLDIDNEYLPTRSRDLHALDGITAVTGDLNVSLDDSVHEIRFANLVTVDDDIHLATNDALRAYFPKLETARSLELDGPGSYEFSSLKSLGTLRFHRGPELVTGFGALAQVGTLAFVDSGQHTLDFPKLAEVTGQLLLMGPHTYDGELPELASVNYMRVRNADIAALKLPALTTISDTLSLEQTEMPTAPFTALETVGGNLSLTSPTFFASQTHEGFAKLVAVGGSLTIDASRISAPTNAYNALETIGGRLHVSVNCGSGLFDSFNGLTEVSSVSLTASNCDVRGFASLEELPGSFSYSGGSEYSSFPKLTLVGGNVNFTARAPSHDLPSLVVVDGSFQVNGFDDLAGFQALEVVEGDFQIRGSQWSKLTGFGALDGIGGNATFPSRMPIAEVDRLIDQLGQFSGRVFFR